MAEDLLTREDQFNLLEPESRLRLRSLDAAQFVSHLFIRDLGFDAKLVVVVKLVGGSRQPDLVDWDALTFQVD